MAEPKRIAKLRHTRTDDVLLAEVSRDHFEVIGLFGHSVFDDENPNAMPAERDRLWNLSQARMLRGAPPGSAVLFSSIATSGHSTQTVMMAQDYARTIQSWDP